MREEKWILRLERVFVRSWVRERERERVRDGRTRKRFYPYFNLSRNVEQSI